MNDLIYAASTILVGLAFLAVAAMFVAAIVLLFQLLMETWQERRSTVEHEEFLRELTSNRN